MHSLQASARGTEKHLGPRFSRCLLRLSLPSRRPLLLSLSPFHCWNNCPGQFLWAPPHSRPKPKTILNPHDQACSRFVWYVASARAGVGGMHASNLYSGMPASRGAGGGPRSGEPRTTGFQGRARGRGKDRQLGVPRPRARQDFRSAQALALHRLSTPRPLLVSHIVWILDFTLYSVWLLLFFNEVSLKSICLGWPA